MWFEKRHLGDGPRIRTNVSVKANSQVIADELEITYTSNDLTVSALLKDTIPPAFVRLEDSDGETIVSKVAALDIDTPKVDLLISLGRVAQEAGVTDETLREIDAFLENLVDLEDVEGLEQRLEERLR